MNPQLPPPALEDSSLLQALHSQCLAHSSSTLDAVGSWEGSYLFVLNSEALSCFSLWQHFATGCDRLTQQLVCFPGGAKILCHFDTIPVLSTQSSPSGKEPCGSQGLAKSQLHLQGRLGWPQRSQSPKQHRKRWREGWPEGSAEKGTWG